MQNFYFAFAPGGGSEAAGPGSLGLLIFFFVLAIGVSFFCSVWEAVLLSVTRPYIEHLKKDNPKAGGRLKELKSKIDRPLISILTLNTVAHTMGSMGVAAEFSKLTGGGIWDKVCAAVMTLAILIASEIIPKNLGARYWKKWAPWVSSCLHWLSLIMTKSGIVKAIGFFSRGGHHTETFSREELEGHGRDGKKGGQTPGRRIANPGKSPHPERSHRGKCDDAPSRRFCLETRHLGSEVSR